MDYPIPDPGANIDHRSVVVDVVPLDLSVVEIGDDSKSEDQKQLDERQKWMFGFWKELLTSLTLDDREQPPAKPLAGGNIYFSLPARGDLWITCYFDPTKNEAGVFLGYNAKSQAAVEVINQIELDRESINAEFKESGLKLTWTRKSNGKLRVITSLSVSNIRMEQYRKLQLEWFSKAINAFVNVFRPRVAAAWQARVSN